MIEKEIFQKLEEHGVVPVIAIESLEAAIPLTDALLEGGLPVIEITFRTEAAADVIQRIAEERPEMLVGAGTVLTVKNFQAAKQCKAKFCVAPGLNPNLVTQAQLHSMPFIPGVATPSDVECGLAIDCSLQKFFPAEANGGVKMLQALSAPYRHTGVKFVPTGGVNMGNIEHYLSLDTVAAVGGTWLAKSNDISTGNWSEITQRCHEVGEVVARIRAE